MRTRMAAPASATAPWPELTTLRFDAAFAEHLRAFVAPFAQSLSWPELSLIPRERHPASLARTGASLARAVAQGQHLYLAKTPGQSLLRSTYALLRGERAARWYDLLCLNQVLDVRELAPAWSVRELDRFVDAGVLLRRDTVVMLPLTIVPWGARWYAGESLHLRENAALYGTRGVPLDPETHEQIRWFRRAYAGRRFRRFFESGTGSGIVTLELADLAAAREGGEYDARGLMFAQLNGALHDPSVRFVETDVLSGARGTYDLMHFAPWQPTESTLHLVLAYLEAVPQHLDPDGEAVVFVSHRGDARDDRVLTPISDTLDRLGLIAEQDVLNAYDHGESGVVGQSFLRVRRGRRAQPIMPLRTARWLAFEARRALRARR